MVTSTVKYELKIEKKNSFKKIQNSLVSWFSNHSLLTYVFEHPLSAGLNVFPCRVVRPHHHKKKKKNICPWV